MRGGTSRGALFRVGDLPQDASLRERLIVAIYGSPDVRQIDGIGGADPLTSKVGIVGPSNRPDADVDFLFGQVRIREPRVDFRGNCGNLTAAVAPFSIDVGWVPVREPVTQVRIHLVNTGGMVTADVRVRDGVAEVEGDAEVAGVPGRGAPIVLDFGESADTLGRGLLPTGSVREALHTSIGDVDVSIVDAGNPVVFVTPGPFGLTGIELPADFRPDTLAALEEVRAAGAVRLGLAPNIEAGHVTSPAIPKVYIVSPSVDYTDLSGRTIRHDEIALVARGMSMGAPHKAYAGTVAICTGAASLLPGTVVHEVVGKRETGSIRIGHPSGVIGVDVALSSDGRALSRASIERTARWIMDGVVYAPLSRVLFTEGSGGARID
jgi:2-methylaconitate cis-trans-isomerase PrpF